MKLKFSQSGLAVDLDVPEPLVDSGNWYEATEYRPKNKTDVLAYDGLGKKIIYLTTQFPVWIFQAIPRATPEQLSAIGMREKFNKPTWLERGDVVWNGSGVTDPMEFCKYCRDIYSKWGWVLVPAAPIETEMHRKFGVDELSLEAMVIPCKDCGKRLGVHCDSDCPNGEGPIKPAAPVVEKPCSTCGKEKCRLSEYDRKLGNVTGCENSWTPAPAATVPDAQGGYYYYLKTGEIIQQGDECYFTGARVWVETVSSGERVEQGDLRYRRRINAPREPGGA